MHEVEASTSEYEAAGQGTQSDDWPPDVAYEPALHSWQSDAESAPAGATDPPGHALQLEVQFVQPLAAQEPAAHALHVREPSDVAVQTAQEREPAGEVVPCAHRMHAAAEVAPVALWYV